MFLAGVSSNIGNAFLNQLNQTNSRTGRCFQEMQSVTFLCDRVNESCIFNVQNVWGWRNVPDAALEVLIKMSWTHEVFTSDLVNKAFLYVTSLI